MTDISSKIWHWSLLFVVIISFVVAGIFFGIFSGEENIVTMSDTSSNITFSWWAMMIETVILWMV